MTLINDLKNICKNISGNVISIGLSYPTVESVLEKNDKIINGYILEFTNKKRSKDKNNHGKKNKKISIKKLRKSFKKKSVDTVICNYEDVKKYIRFFVRDSIYINSGKLYIYGKKDDYVLEDLEEFYNRYKTTINITEYDNEFLMEIDNSLAKNNWVKDKIYRIKDTVIYYINVIGDIMVG